MRYCSKCGKLSQQEKCPKCGKKTREIKENEPVLLAGLDVLRAAMLEPLLKEAGIPYSRMGTVGAAFAMSGGMTLEEIRIYVPFSAYDQARELWEMIGPEADVQEVRLES